MIDVRSVRDLVHAAAHELVGCLFPGAAVQDEPPAASPACLIGGRTHPAQDGMLICRHHFDELGRLLHDIEDESAILSAAPSLAMSYERSTGGLASERAPLRLNVVAFTDPRTNLVPTSPRPDRQSRQAKHIGPWCLFCDHDTCRDWRAGRQRDQYDDEQDAGSDHLLSAEATLHSWADNVRDDRELTPPAHVTISGERDLLTRQLRYIAEQYWVVDFHRELHDLAAEIKRANNTLEVHVGTCDTLRPNGTLCDGKVWHVLIKPDGKVVRGGSTPGPDDEPGFQCGACRRVWTGTDAVRKRNDMWLDEQTRKTEKGKISS